MKWEECEEIGMWTLKSGFPALYGLYFLQVAYCMVLALFEAMNMITSSKHAHTFEYVK